MGASTLVIDVTLQRSVVVVEANGVEVTEVTAKMEFEEKYLRIRDENQALKKKKNEQEATIKRMYTKMAMIEEALKKKRQGEQSDNQEDDTVQFRKRDFESEQFVHALKCENAALRKQTQTFAAKNRILEEKLQLRRRLRASPRTKVRTRTISPAKAAAHSSVTDAPSLRHQLERARMSHRANTSSALEVALKTRMVTAEKQVVALHQQNQTLRKALRQSDDTADNQRPDTQDETQASQESDDQALNKLRIQQLERELGDRQAQLVLLNSRFDALEAKANAERDIQESTLCQLEKANQTLHKLRNQLQDAQIECQHEKARASKLNETTREMNLLREQNRKLEERMTSLCESPFINDAFQRKERIDKLLELEKTTRQQQEALMHLHQERSRLELLVRDLQNQVEIGKRTNQSLEKELQAVRSQLAQEQERHAAALNAITSSQMNLQVVSSPLSRLTTQPSLVEKRDASSSPLKTQQTIPTTTGNPFTKVSRKYDASAVPQESFELATDPTDSVKHMRNRLHMLQIAHLKATQELERCEKMLETQMTINRELTQEIEQLTTRQVSGTKSLQLKLREMETLAEERQRRVESLEALVRQLRYTCRQPDEDPAETSEAEEDDEVASEAESLELAARNLAPGEHLLEIWIVSGTFDKSVVSGTTSTFVLCDFFDFESQSTPLLTGNRPAYNFSATFRVTVDGFFLRFLASDSLKLEVHQAVRGDFRLFGCCSLKLAGLLSSRGSIRENAAVMRSVSNREVVLGTLNVVVRLSTPISEVWKLHLQSFPQDAQLLNRVEKPPNDSSLDDSVDQANPEGTNANELQITVTGCRNLRSYGCKREGARRHLSRIPSSYVHYQLLGFPDVFTNIVPESANPEFDPKVSRQFFLLHVDSCLLRFFEKFMLCFTVFDDNTEPPLGSASSSSSNDGMIGHCSISLCALAKGEFIRGWFSLCDRNDKPAGEIALSITWKDPFAVFQQSRQSLLLQQQEMVSSLTCLDLEQVHSLVLSFTRPTDGRVNYDQFLLLATPPQALETVLNSVRDGFEDAIENRQLKVVEDAFPRDPARNKPKRIISMNQCKSILCRFGISLSEQELHLLYDAFRDPVDWSGTPSVEDHVNDADAQWINVHFLLLHINPRLCCADRFLQHKVRHTLANFWVNSDQRRHPMEIFRAADSDNTRHIGRTEFKRCLSALGFELLGLEHELRELLKTTHDKQPSELLAVAQTPSSDKSDSKEKRLDANEQVIHSMAEETARCTTQHHPRSAMTEFQERKAAFLDRMKSIADANNRSVVYETLESRIREKLLKNEQQAVINQKQIQHQLEQLPALHEKQSMAARVLQRKFREHFTALRKDRLKSHISIIDVHIELENCFESWSDSQISEFRKELLERLRAITESNQRNPTFISRKQLGFVLSNASGFALKPSSLRFLMDRFGGTQDASKRATGRIDYEALVDFICGSKAFAQSRFINRNSTLNSMTEMVINVPALSTALRRADRSNSGRLGFASFQKCLQQSGVRFSNSLLRMVTLLFDWNGIEILHRSFLGFVKGLPLVQRVARLVSQLRRFGASTIRKQLLLHLDSDDGLMTKQQMMDALALAKQAEMIRLTTVDGSLLFDCLDNKREGRVHLQTLVDYVQNSEQEDTDGDCRAEASDMEMIKSLAMNARRLVSCSFCQALDAFQRFDWENRGLVTLSDFLFVADKVVFGVLSPQQLEAIAKQFGELVDGKFGVRYRHVLEWATPPTRAGIQEIECKLREFVQERAQTLDNRNRAGRIGTEKGAVSQLMESWKQTFASEDLQKKGVLTRKTFARVCTEKLGLPLSTEDMHVVLYAYDQLLNDVIHYDSFLKLSWKELGQKPNHATPQEQQIASIPSSSSRNTQSGSSHAEISSVVKRIKEVLKQRRIGYQEVSQVFQRICSVQTSNTNSNFIDETQFVLGMRQVGVHLSTESAQSLFTQDGNKDRRGRLLDLDKFLRQDIGLFPSESRSTASGFQTTEEEEQQRVDILLQNASKYSPGPFRTAFGAMDQICKSVNFQDVEHGRAWKLVQSSGLTAVLLPKGTGLLLKRFLKRDNTVAFKALHSYLKSFAGHAVDHANKPIPCSPGSGRIEVAAASPLHFQSDRHQPPQFKSPTKATLEAQLGEAIEIAGRLFEDCEAKGVDTRGVFEQYDVSYTGFVSAFEFKSALQELGIQHHTYHLGWDMVVGLLVRRFRVGGDQDRVAYREMLHVETDNASGSAFEETLRARLRTKAGFHGRVPCNPEVYALLDKCFALFDRDSKGFIEFDELDRGLLALDLDPQDMDDHQMKHLLSSLAVYRTPSGNALSRCEFDSFVLDPRGGALLDRIARRLYEEKEPDGDSVPCMPRIAVLSRACQGRDPYNGGLLPTKEAIECIETALSKTLSSYQRFQLQHLFDVDRNGMFAYKLLFKSVCHRSSPPECVARLHQSVRSIAPVAPVHDSSLMPNKPVEEFHPAKKQLLQMLHRQLCTIDFDQQLQVMRGYLDDKSHDHGGVIPKRQLLQVFETIGISLSYDAVHQLKTFYSESSSKPTQLQYKRLLHDLEGTHQAR